MNLTVSEEMSTHANASLPRVFCSAQFRDTSHFCRVVWVRIQMPSPGIGTNNINGNTSFSDLAAAVRYQFVKTASRFEWTMHFERAGEYKG